MRKPLIRLLAVLAAAALSACAKPAPDERQAASNDGDPVNAAAQVAFQFQPGKYRTSIAIEKIEIPGVPAALAGQMKAAMSKAVSREHCMSAEQAAKGVEAMKQHMGEGKCQFESFNARGGTIDSVFTCRNGSDMTLRSAAHGTYSATGSQVAAKAEMNGPGGSLVRIEQTVTTTRIGACS